jgi:hypothetical protein
MRLYEGIMQLLVDKGADINAKNDERLTGGDVAAT